MKKILAIVFTLIFALSACTVAFAEEAKAFNATCKYCEKIFTDVKVYNDHIDACKKANTETKEEDPEENVKHVCAVCAAVFDTRTAYMDHMNGDCLVAYKVCPYCEATIDTAAIDDHKAICPKGARNCDYCFEDFATQGEYDAHLKACKEKFLSIPVAKVVRAVLELIENTDWGSLFGKIGDALKGIDLGGIVEKIKPVFEKIPALLEGLGK